MNFAIPMPDSWVLVVLGVVGLLLFGLAFWAQAGYKVDAEDWIKSHAKWLDAHETTWQSGTEWPKLREGLPSPLGDRIQLLMSSSVTSLAEGDLGRFLLRRPEVRGQAALGSVANFLISLALATTIVGLIATLFGLVKSAKASGIEMNAMVSAISHFPWFFMPTFLGVLLGALANWKQASIDAEFELLWDRIDSFTIVHLIPKYIKPKSALDAATDKLMQAAGLFEGSGQKLAGTIGQLESAASKLSQLDPTQWAVGLKETSGSFERATEAYQTHVGELGKSVKGFGELLDQQTKVTEANSQSIAEVTALVKAASGYKDELSAVLLGFKASLDTVRSLKGEIEQFHTDVKGLSQSVLRWSDTQDSAASQLAKEVANLTKPLGDGIERWADASKFFTDNHSTQKAQMEGVVEQLAQLGRHLHEDQEKQIAELAKIFQGFETKTGDYWKAAMSGLEEQFDHPPDVLQELRKLSASLEGAQKLGTNLPGLSESLSEGSQRFTQTIASLSGTVEQLAAQQRAHQDALVQVSDRLAQISEKLDRPVMHETSPAATSTLSSRTILGLPIGPPPWMSRLLKRFSKEGKP